LGPPLLLLLLEALVSLVRTNRHQQRRLRVDYLSEIPPNQWKQRFLVALALAVLQWVLPRRRLLVEA
jgi:hypothetical protein